jgi:hypothetical protein
MYEKLVVERSNVTNCVLLWYVTQKGDASHSKDEIRLPAGWAWESGWEVDQNRAVDEEGNSAVFCLYLFYWSST